MGFKLTKKAWQNVRSVLVNSAKLQKEATSYYLGGNRLR